ncbi:Notch receptor processing [Sparganum proliferum]
MTLRTAFGCGLVAFGPVVALFLVTCARHPLRIILLALSAFFWLVGLLVSSLLWFAVVPLREQLAFGLVFTVLFQELVRFLYFFLIQKVESGLRSRMSTAEGEREPDPSVITYAANSQADVDSDMPLVTPKTAFLNHHLSAYTAGLGFALMGCITEYIFLFSQVTGPGTPMEDSRPGVFFLLAAVDSCFMSLSQIAWSVLLFRAYRLRKYLEIVIVIAAHIGLSSLSLVNGLASPAPELLCALLVVSFFVFLIWAFFAAGGTLRRRTVARSE